jgi:hypothetical protein
MLLIPIKRSRNSFVVLWCYLALEKYCQTIKRLGRGVRQEVARAVPALDWGWAEKIAADFKLKEALNFALWAIHFGRGSREDFTRSDPLEHC